MVGKARYCENVSESNGLAYSRSNFRLIRGTLCRCRPRHWGRSTRTRRRTRSKNKNWNWKN